jgi:HK97 family phage major capsid protein
MLESVKLQKRQSEIRQELATLAGKADPEAEELRSMEKLDAEYGSNEIRYRASLIAEDHERKEAGQELEGRSEKEFRELIDAFEVRQVIAALDEGRPLSSQTLEVVTELRSKGGFQGLPVPWLALEQRAGETTADGTPNPRVTRNIIDRLFPTSVAARMGAELINIGSGELEYPVCTAGVTAAWAATETGDVAAPTAYTTVDRVMTPSNTLGAQVKLTRKSMKQTGNALELAVRRDLASAIASEMDKAAFLGAGSGGEPLGIVTGQSTYGIDINDASAEASYAIFRAAGVEFMTRNAANSLQDIRLLMRTELLNTLDDTVIEAGSGITFWDFIVKRFGTVLTTSNALSAPAGGPPAESTAVMCTSVGGVSPFTIGLWGSLDMVRDNVTGAASGSLLITALATMDVAVARPAQIGLISGLQ